MASVDELAVELARVADATAATFRPPGADELLRAIAEAARRVFGAAACSLALLDDDDATLVYTTVVGAGAEEVAGMRLPVDRGVAGWVVQSGQPIAADDLASDPRFARDVAEATGYVPRSLVAVPVRSPRRILGVLSLLDRDTSRPEAVTDLETASVFADQAALAIEGSRDTERLGRVLLAALAAAAAGGTPLADRLAAAADELGDDRGLLGIAALLAELATAAPADRDLAVRVLREFTAAGRSSRPDS